MKSVPIVFVTRGPETESVHCGRIAVVGPVGRLVRRLGDADGFVYARSAAKPLQAVPVVESLAADRFGFGARELAVLCVSHSGEPAHASLVRDMLARIGLAPDALQCGVHEPFDKDAAFALVRAGEPFTALHNNCSGMHAGMLALAVAIGAPTEGYFWPDHLVQRLMLEAASDICGLDPDDVRLATDGCGVPVFGMPLERLAYGYMRWGTGSGLAERRTEACRRLREGLVAEPYYLAGRGRFDTRLIEATSGRIVGKMGAEGVFAFAVPEAGLGGAVKVEDGAQRALYAAVCETLRQLDLLSPGELAELERFHRPPVLNRRGEEVGRIEPRFRLAPPADS